MRRGVEWNPGRELFCVLVSVVRTRKEKAKDSPLRILHYSINCSLRERMIVSTSTKVKALRSNLYFRARTGFRDAQKREY
jgi:hypothetical protein